MKAKPYHVPLHLKDAVSKYNRKMENLNVTERSDSSYYNPMVEDGRKTAALGFMVIIGELME